MLEIPDTGLKDHEGNPRVFTIDPNDPVAKAAKAWLKKNNLPQSAATSMMADMYAPLITAAHESAVQAAQTRKSQALSDLGEGDVQKGSDYAVRVLRSALAAFPDADTAHDAGLKEALATPAAVKAIEALMNRLSAEGSGRNTPRDGGEQTESKLERRARLLYGKKEG